MKFYKLLSYTILFLLFLPTAQAQIPKELKSFQVYNQKGKELRFDKWIKDLAKEDVILFGELHNSAINHWLQYETLKALHAATEANITVGAEMFERDAQIVINEYLNGIIKLNHLISEGKAWDNFKTDYLPILDFCKDSGINFIATNVPRRYASLVSREGLDGLNRLSEEGKKYVYNDVFEVSMDTPGYQEMLGMMGHGHGGGNPMNFVTAQAIKDITMAESIAKNKEDKKLFLHLNGDFHSKSFGGIYWYLNQLDKGLDAVVISVVLSDSVQDFDESWSSLGDYIIVINQNVTTTY